MDLMITGTVLDYR